MKKNVTVDSGDDGRNGIKWTQRHHPYILFYLVDFK